jgi:hypothetical protein
MELESSTEMKWEEDILAKRISEIENDERVTLKVTGTLIAPDPLVIGAQQELSKRNERSARDLEYDGVLSNSNGLLIRVAPKNINRALRLFNALIKAFRARGFQFLGSNVILGKHSYEISMREKLERLDNLKKKPTNILCVKVYSGYPTFEIYDSKSVLIEEKISRIIAKVELDIEYFERAWAEVTQREEAARLVEERKTKILNTKKEELAAFKTLLRSAIRHHEVKLIRDYINFKEELANQNEKYDEALKDWIEWARKKADWYDPSISCTDSILGPFDGDLTS